MYPSFSDFRLDRRSKIARNIRGRFVNLKRSAKNKNSVCDEEFEFKNERQEHLSQGIQEWTK